MKADWIQKLFSQEPSAKALPEELSRWSELLAPLAGPSPTGEEVSSNDVFLGIKEQFSRISGMDVEQLVTDCQVLLAKSGKDLRPAVYLTYGLLRQDGYEGLASGLELVALLLHRFGDEIWPRRPEVRKSTLEWLCSVRLTDWLDSLLPPSSHERDQVTSSLALLQQQSTKWGELLQPNLEPLRKRFEREELAEQILPAPEIPLHSIERLPSGGGSGEIQSSQALMESLRAMAAYLRQQAHGEFAAYRLVRCVRWDNVPSPPPHDGQGLTRLPGPRQELRQQLKRLVLQKQWHAVLEKIEPAFMEGANHFWLDLQYYAWQALGQLGEGYRNWRDIALADLAQMRERLAGVEQLRFSDGSSFADDVTLEWLASHAVIMDIEAGELVGSMPVLAGNTVDEQTMQREAFALADSQGLEHALAWMQSLPQSHGERHMAFRQALMAQLAESKGRVDIALHLISGLDDRLSLPAIKSWEPGFVFDVKATYLRLLRQRNSRKDADRSQSLALIQRLMAELTQLDPVRALLLPTE